MTYRLTVVQRMERHVVQEIVWHDHQMPGGGKRQRREQLLVELLQVRFVDLSSAVSGLARRIPGRTGTLTAETAAAAECLERATPS